LKRILIFGGRDYPNRRAVEDALYALLAKHGEFTLVHGACPTGADRFAAEWCGYMLALSQSALNLTEEPHPADWEKHGNSAGPRRNAEMAASKLDGAVGFHGGRGTADMARRCEEHGVAVWWPAGR